MKKQLTVAALIGGALIGTTAVTAQEGGGPALETLAAKVSYSLGYQIGISFGADIDMGLLQQGFKDGLAKKKPPLSEMDMRQAMNTYQREKQQRESKENVEKGKAFLDANKAKEGVKTTESGLQYTVIKEGTGPSPAATDKVTVHYHGTLIDGSVFDSSVERGEPTSFPLNRVIKGWTEGLQLMKVGGKTKFFIPSDLGYGPRSPSPKIPANSVLIFEVELISIEGK